jgi:hypothetical protein
MEHFKIEMMKELMGLTIPLNPSLSDVRAYDKAVNLYHKEFKLLKIYKLIRQDEDSGLEYHVKITVTNMPVYREYCLVRIFIHQKVEEALYFVLDRHITRLLWRELTSKGYNVIT